MSFCLEGERVSLSILTRAQGSSGIWLLGGTQHCVGAVAGAVAGAMAGVVTGCDA